MTHVNKPNGFTFRSLITFIYINFITFISKGKPKFYQFFSFTQLHHFMAASVSSSSQSGNSQILHKSKNAEASKTKKSEIDYVVSELSSVKISQDSASSHSHLPPPPLPPPLPSTVVKSNISQSQQITRLDPNCVTWMKKNL